MKPRRAWTAGSVLGWIAEAAGFRRRRVAALVVLNDGDSILEDKVQTLARVLRAGLRTHGYCTLSPASSAAVGPVGTPAFDAHMLRLARGCAAEYLLVVAMRDLSCRVDDARLWNLPALRVETTVCVEFQVIEARSGRLLAQHALAHCRTTSPIVRGTSIGSELVDLLLAEVAAQIASHMGSLPFAA
jgi:hypothetical protein